MEKEFDIYKISEKIQSSSKDIDKQLHNIVERPLIKKVVYFFNKNKQLQDLEDAFEFFNGKKDELFTRKEELKNLGTMLLSENTKLEEQISKLKSSEENDVELLVQMETKLVVNKEILMNEVPILLDMIENILVKLEKTLPFIERTIKQRLVVNGSLKTLNYVIKKTIELEEYSKTLEKENSKAIKSLVSESTEMIINSIDVDYYKDMKERNKELTSLFKTSKEKYYNKLNQMEKELTEIINQDKVEDVRKIKEL